MGIFVKERLVTRLTDGPRNGEQVGVTRPWYSGEQVVAAEIVARELVSRHDRCPRTEHDR